MSTPPVRRREATVADVAREARVSKATAARALGDYGAVSDSVRDRVQAAAEALGYRPNQLARSMNTGKSNTIGVVVGDIENPYFGLAMRGISDAAKAEGFDVILVNTSEDVGAEVDAVRVLLDKRVDGLIVAPASSTDTAHLRSVYESWRPLVLLDRRIDHLDVDVVEADMTTAAYEATRHLTSAGHRRIAFISTLDVAGREFEEGLELQVSSVADRLDGVLAAQQDAGIPDAAELVRFTPEGAPGVKRVVRELLALPNPPTALIASDSLIAMSAFGALRDLGLSVPTDVSFVMFDDFEWTTLTSPPLTVVSQPIYDMGVMAARIVIGRVQGRNLPDVQRTFPATLVVRESVAPPPAEIRGGAMEPLSAI
jgi:LacI family transcriptional regulator